MKKSFYKQFFSLMACAILLAAIGCKKDIDKIVKEQEQNNIFYPRIFDTHGALVYLKTIQQGDTVKYDGLLYSPADKVSISWKVNDKEVSTDTKYYFIGTTPGDYVITLDVSFQGNSANRTSLITVE